MSSLSQFVPSLLLALQQDVGNPWYTSTKELQRTCRDICEACRRTPTLVVRVTRSTPRILWSAGAGDSSAIPVIEAYGLEWALPLQPLVFESCVRMRRKVVYLKLSPMEDGFDVRLTCLRLFKHLKHLKLERFDESIDNVVWPRSLEYLEFGRSFNQPIQKVTWPTSLVCLSLGLDFNQPIVGVTWPPFLDEVRFFPAFNQCIEDVVWPQSLTKVSFGFPFEMIMS